MDRKGRAATETVNGGDDFSYIERVRKTQYHRFSQFHAMGSNRLRPELRLLGSPTGVMDHARRSARR